ISVKPETLEFSMKGLGASFAGGMNVAGTEATGLFKQSGASFPLILKRVEKPSQLSRPQTPRPPFPYREETLNYASRAGGVQQVGMLAKASGANPEQVQASVETERKLLAAALAELDDAKRKEAFQKVFAEMREALSEEDRKTFDQGKPAIEAQLRQLDLPWF